MSKKRRKPTWIFICGTYRTASTTCYEITRDIVSETGNGKGIGYHQEGKLSDFDIPAQEPYIVCKVFEYLPDGFQGKPSLGQFFHRKGRLKAIATIRDPRDIITSMRERHNRQMENPEHQRIPFDYHHRVTVDFPIWLGQLERWIDLGPNICMVSRYESFTKDLLNEVNRIASHLGITISPILARDIASRYTPEAIMVRKKAKREAKQKEDPWLPGIPGILFGTVGAHKDHLSPEEEELLIEYNGDWMRRFAYL